jgi:adenosine deaminase CECR1
MKKTFQFIFAIFLLTNYSPAQISENVQEYLHKRNDAIAKDSAMRLGAQIILSPDEKDVDNFLSKLRTEYLLNAGWKFPPAFYFYRFRNMIDTSRVFDIIRMMPKGGLLHSHSSAVGSPEWIIKKASYMDNLYMFTGATENNNVYGTLGFYSPGNEPEGYRLVSELRNADPDFDSKLRKLLFLDESDFQNPDIWVRFEEIFTRQGKLLSYYPVFIEHNLVMIDSLISDNVQHLEMRTFLGGVYNLDGKRYNPEEVLNLYKMILDSARKTHPEFSMKLIRSGYRGWNKENVLNYMIETIQLRKKYPDFLKGFDLVGEEDAGHTTLFFIDEFLKRDSLERAYGIDLPFYFHDGESTLPTDSNLYDAVLLNSRRIGHGINLFRFPYLFELIKEKNIALEVCPLSNQILGYVDNLRMHPASEYINRGIPITISSDDPQLFDYTGLSYDFWTAYMAWNLGLAQLKQIALNSIIYSAMTESEKQKALAHFNGEWERFIGRLRGIVN